MHRGILWSQRGYWGPTKNIGVPQVLLGSLGCYWGLWVVTGVLRGLFRSWRGHWHALREYWRSHMGYWGAPGWYWGLQGVNGVPGGAIGVLQGKLGSPQGIRVSKELLQSRGVYWGPTRIIGVPQGLLGSPGGLWGFRVLWEGVLPSGVLRGGRRQGRSHQGGCGGVPSAAWHCGAIQSPPRGSLGHLCGGGAWLLTRPTHPPAPQGPTH